MTMALPETSAEADELMLSADNSEEFYKRLWSIKRWLAVRWLRGLWFSRAPAILNGYGRAAVLDYNQQYGGMPARAGREVAAYEWALFNNELRKPGEEWLATAVAIGRHDESTRYSHPLVRDLRKRFAPMAERMVELPQHVSAGVFGCLLQHVGRYEPGGLDLEAETIVANLPGEYRSQTLNGFVMGAAREMMRELSSSGWERDHEAWMTALDLSLNCIYAASGVTRRTNERARKSLASYNAVALAHIAIAWMMATGNEAPSEKHRDEIVGSFESTCMPKPRAKRRRA